MKRVNNEFRTALKGRLNPGNKAIITNGRYLLMDIHAKINGRQNRNKLNYNNPFMTYYFWVMQFGEKSINTDYPTINNGLYHPCGKNHSQYKTSK